MRLCTALTVAAEPELDERRCWRWRSSEAERAERLRADDAVDRQPMRRLVAAHGVPSLGAVDAVGCDAERALHTGNG